MPTDRPALAVLPVRLAGAGDLDAALRCAVSLKVTAPDAALLVIDDASPEPALTADLEVALGELGGELVRGEEPAGALAALNVGLTGALEYGFDAVLVDPAAEFSGPGWLDRMRARTDGQGRPAAIVGARLVDRRGLIAHAGIYLSLLRLEWFNRFQHGPADLPEALAPCRCPVTASLALVRHEAIAALGLLDLRLAELADVDYCLRAFEAGLEVIYEPTAVATLTTPLPVPPETAGAAMKAKWHTPDLARWIPDPL